MTRSTRSRGSASGICRTASTISPGVDGRAGRHRHDCARRTLIYGFDQTHHTDSGCCGSGNGRRAAPVCSAIGQSRPGKFYERGPVRIYYEEAGSGFPLLLLPGGGLNSTIGFFTGNSPFNAIEEFKGEYRCITADLRNAPSGQSTGPVEVDRPWESYADDQLGLMDHLGIDKFMVMGFCIGGPFIWSLLKRAPNRIAAAVMAQPVGWRPEMRDREVPRRILEELGRDVDCEAARDLDCRRPTNSSPGCSRPTPTSSSP